MVEDLQGIKRRWCRIDKRFGYAVERWSFLRKISNMDVALLEST